MYKVNTLTAARPAKGLVGRMFLQAELRGNFSIIMLQSEIIFNHFGSPAAVYDPGIPMAFHESRANIITIILALISSPK